MKLKMKATEFRIGFATEFYTLWSYGVEELFITDAYGNHHRAGIREHYGYIKNISKSLEAVMSAYPQYQIDDSLKGKTRNWVNDRKEGGRLEVIWFGKYYGKLWDEILNSDFDYCLWASSEYPKMSSYVLTHPKYIAYLEAKDNEKNVFAASLPILKIGVPVEVNITSNAGVEECEDCSNQYYIMGFVGGIRLKVYVSSVKEVCAGTKYEHLIPTINGVAIKLKGKSAILTPERVSDLRVYGNGDYIAVQDIWVS